MSRTCNVTGATSRVPTGRVDLYDGVPQNQSANFCLSVMRKVVATTRSKTPSSSSVSEAPVAAERQAIPGLPSPKADRPIGWQAAWRTGRPFR
jgi:hypothetical protein